MEVVSSTMPEGKQIWVPGLGILLSQQSYGAVHGYTRLLSNSIGDGFRMYQNLRQVKFARFSP